MIIELIPLRQFTFNLSETKLFFVAMRKDEIVVKFISFQKDIWNEFFLMIVLFAVPRSSVIAITVFQMVAEVTLKLQDTARLFYEAFVGNE